MSDASTRGSVRILLLGPGGRDRPLLTYRRCIKRQLNEMGYTNVKIMEDVSDDISDGGIDKKFSEILRQFDPMFIFVFFHKDEKMDAVMFELGYICCLYENDILKDRLKFLFDTEGYDVVEETTAYIDTLLPNINHYDFNDLKSHRRAVRIIHRMIANR